MKKMQKNDFYFIFDLDGTVADTLEDIADSINYMLTELGFAPKTKTEIKYAIGTGIEDIVYKLTGNKEKSFIDKAVSLFREKYEINLINKTKLYKGVKKFISDKNTKASIVSNKPDKFTKKICKHLKILKHLDECIGSNSIFPHKPDPAGTKFIIEKHAKGKIPIFIGDSIIDKQTAENANIKFCLALYGYEKPETLKQIKSDFKIKHFDELNSIFI